MKTNRKGFIGRTALLALIWLTPLAALADPPQKTVRMGLLFAGWAEMYTGQVDALREGLREHGYVEGKNLVVERRYAEGSIDRLSGFAQELTALKVDAIVTTCSPSTLAARQATTTIPIVMSNVADPVEFGLVQSLAHPGGNITGRSSQSVDLVPKMLELFHSTVPQAKPIAVLVNTKNPLHEAMWRRAEAAALALHVTLLRVESPGAAGLDAAFDTIVGQRVSALLLLPDDPMTFNRRARIVEFVGKQRLPTFFYERAFVDAGGLMSYGANFVESYRQTATYIDKVVRGVNPADLPIEQPTHFELVVNLKTAKALGISVPQSVLVLAERVIE